jgi:hypothetical protein
MPNRRALIIGIDEYPGNPLHGCVNDATEVANLLRANEDGSPNFDVRLVTGPPTALTRAQLLEEITQLFNHDGAEVALFYFSGHGTENNLGGYLVTPDAAKYSEGLSLGDVLTLANNSPANERVVILDSCMSGALGNLPAINNSAANLNEGVAVLTASRSNQLSYEVAGRGVFTELLCGALEGGAADVLGEVTVGSVYSYVEQALGPWQQRPLFKAHVSTLVPLRRCVPPVPLETLRELPSWFPMVDSVFPLDPTFEDQEPNHIPANVAVFKKLQRCRDAKLVEAVDAEFMYFAAKNSTGCRLTPLGKHYWRLATARRI